MNPCFILKYFIFLTNKSLCGTRRSNGCRQLFFILAVCFGFQFSFSGELEDIRNLALKFYKDGRYKFALEQFQKLLVLTPKHPANDEVQYYIAQSYYFLNQKKDALRVYQELIENYPKSIKIKESVYQLAQCYLDVKDFRRAAQNFYKFFQDYPDDPQSALGLFMAGLAHFFEEDLENAQEKLNRFIQRFPTHIKVPEGLYYLGQVYVKKQQLAVALETIETLTIQYSQNQYFLPRGLILLAELYEKTNKPEKAVTVYQEIDRKFSGTPFYETALTRLAELYFQQKAYAQAAQTYLDLVTKAKKEELFLLLRRAECLNLAKDYSGAIEAYQDILQKTDSASVVTLAKFSIAGCYLQLNKSEEAVEYLDELIQLFKSDPYSRKSVKLMGDIYFNEKLYMNAIRNYQDYLKFPEVADKDEVTFKIGQIYERNYKNYAFAIKEYEKLFKDFPASAYLDDAKFNIGQCQEKLKNFKEALLEYQELLLQFSNSEFSARAKERVEFIQNYKVKNYERAIEDLADLLYQPEQKKEGEKLIQLAMIYEKNLKDYAQAIKFYETYVEKFAQDKGLDSVLFRIGEDYEKLAVKARLEKNESQVGSYQTKAEQTFERILKDYPNGPYADNILLENLREQEFKIADYENFVSRYPQSDVLDEVYFYIGQYYLNQFLSGDSTFYTKAVQNYQQITQNFPKSVFSDEALQGLGQIYLSRKEYDSARYFYLEIIKKHSGSKLVPTALCAVGETFLKVNKYEQAIEYFRNVIYKFPSSKEPERALLGMAQAYFQLQQFDKALKYNKLFQNSYPNSTGLPESLYGAGLCYLKFNKRPQAIDSFEKIQTSFELSPMALDAAFQLGKLYGEEEKYYRALEYYNKILRQKDNKRHLRETYLAAGKILFTIQEYKEAAKTYEEGLAFALNSQDSLIALAGYLNAMIISGQKKDLSKIKKAFIKAYPREFETHAGFMFYEGKFLFDKREMDRATKRFEEVLEKYKNTTFAGEALYYLATIYFDEKRSDQALDAYGRFVDKYPQHVLVLQAKFQMASIYFRLQDYSNAATAFQEVARRVKTFDKFGFTATYNAALSFERISVWEQAVEMNKMLYENYKPFIKETELLTKIGFCYTEHKEYEKAQDYYEMALQHSGENEKPEIKFWIATCLSRLGMKEKALEEYLTISYNYPQQGKWGMTAEYEAARIYEEFEDFQNAKMLYEKIVASDGENGEFGNSALMRLNSIKYKNTKK